MTVSAIESGQGSLIRGTQSTPNTTGSGNGIPLTAQNMPTAYSAGSPEFPPLPNHTGEPTLTKRSA